MGAVSPGVPGWVDVGSPDIDETVRFYTGLFGWSAEVGGEEYGGYVTFAKDGQAVAGAAPLMSADQPSSWTTYVIVADAEATAARVAPAGGHVLVAPFDVGDQGRMGVVIDPTGAMIGLWQPLAMRGAEVFNEPGALTWNELATREPGRAKSFYQAVFDWTPVGDEDIRWQLDGNDIGSMVTLDGAPWRDDEPAHWACYFSVADCDETAAAITKLGGTLLVPPADMPAGGRSARAVDPGGASFFISAFGD